MYQNNRYFAPPILFLFCMTLFFTWTILRALISNMTIFFFKTLPKNTQIKYFWSQILGFLVLHETFHFDKLGSVDFKYDNSFLKLLPKTPK